MWRTLLAVCCLAIAPALAGQQRAAELERRWADSTLHDLERNQERDPKRTLDLAGRMLSVYRAERDTCRMSLVTCFACLSYDRLGLLDSAVLAMQRSFDWFRPGCDSLGLMRAYLCMSNVKLSLEDTTAVDSIAGEVRTRWNPAWKQTAILSGVVTNVAIFRATGGDYLGALASFREVLALSRKDGNAFDIDAALANIGVVHEMMGRLDSAQHYYRVALASAQSNRMPNLMVKQYMNLGMLQNARERPDEAIALFDSAAVLARAAGLLEERVKLELEISASYAWKGMHEKANEHLRQHLALKDTLLSIEKVKALTEMQEKYDSEKKAKEILGLKAENLESDLRESRMKRTRNIYLFSAIGVVMLAIGLWSRLRFVHRSKAAIQKEKDISEGLLLNILPEEVAAELKQKGEAEARLIDEVTVLFTDFKGFTAMSEKLSPKDLVRDIHECFSAFDLIMERNGMEKIKTIGDAYMAAGGLPVPNTTHAVDAVRAALELRDFIEQGKQEKVAKGLPYFEVRIGIHTGPVVAGIVGVKKFAYDIWGDTVNTASRMESSGEAGKVNISEATYAMVKDAKKVNGEWSMANGGSIHSPTPIHDSPAFIFTPRGKVQAKGKGEIEMWFVERA